MGCEDMDETREEEEATTAQPEPNVLELVLELKVLFMMLTSVDYFN